MKNWKPVEVCLLFMLLTIPFLLGMAFLSRTVTKIPLSEATMEGLYKIVNAILISSAVIFGTMKNDKSNADDNSGTTK